jgi:ectoine hydroxylase-related dioxygenase (phytanoyl-CoA dioxygenase family)
LYPRSEGPSAARELEDLGFVVLRNVLEPELLSRLTAECLEVYARIPQDRRTDRSTVDNEVYRYEMLNRSALCVKAIGHPRILEVIEPLLGEDCHVIANTCWRNPPARVGNHGGGLWHIDAGPHVPRDPEVPWDDRIPYPVFAIGAHIYLEDCPRECGPTGVLPGTHRSGQAPPRDRLDDPQLTWNGRSAVPLTARAGDVALFVSDVWHRRLPAGPGDRGRFFLQAHYGRRDIAQRVRPTAQVNHLSDEALARIGSNRPDRRKPSAVPTTRRTPASRVIVS